VGSIPTAGNRLTRVRRHAHDRPELNRRQGLKPWSFADQPVENRIWNEPSYRLPTEVWENACRADARGVGPFGDRVDGLYATRGELKIARIG
jgi:hypothetical protein